MASSGSLGSDFTIPRWVVGRLSTGPRPCWGPNQASAEWNTLALDFGRPGPAPDLSYRTAWGRVQAPIF